MIDTTFDFRSDSKGRDPDSASPTLRRYHQLLWSKPLSDGRPFDLEIDSRKGYLYHKSEVGEFVLTSDSVLPTFNRHKSYAHIIDQIPQADRDWFDYITYTIGGMMIFPGNKIDGRMTINGARGCNQRIADRFDLTVECIRRYYRGESSPLYDDLARYRHFFYLFKGFKGYVDFFLLQDLVSPTYTEVQFFPPGGDFDVPPRPATVEAYVSFREHTVAFVESRNARINAQFAQACRGEQPSRVVLRSPSISKTPIGTVKATGTFADKL